MTTAVQSARYPMGRVTRRERHLMTPEGVPLRIELPDPGERFIAFLADVFISFAAAVLILLAGWLAAGMAAHTGPFALTIPATLLMAFLARNAYFIFFELRWAGATPGKRMIGLRVVDRHGGPLRAGAVIARNLTRQAEFFFPIELLLITKGWLWSPLDVALSGLWLTAMCALVLRTPDRLRAGDLIGGTVVIVLPKRVLLEDLARETTQFEFLPQHLEAYGIHELHVLEEVLRQPDNAETGRLRRDIVQRIQRRIGWDRPVPDEDNETFLRDFYTAQRAFLERRKNIGEERRDKFYRESERS
ncbi:MAG TPA: RDD family protein [Bryobacteraceae bacterium]|nr:RDD family protein [Bryobacteraceae bacterium]